MEINKQEKMTFGEKLRSARKSAGLTQEQLAERLIVSRQAITKWESDKGLPDIENLKQLSSFLGVSIDYLLDSGEAINMSVTREKINLENYTYAPKITKRLVKKAGKKDMVVAEKYPDADIHYLMAKQIPTKNERIINNLIGFLTDAPFGIPDLINGIKNTDKEFYLVDKEDKQYIVTVTDDFIESRQLCEKITVKKFNIGSFSFTVCGIIKKGKKRMDSDRM